MNIGTYFDSYQLISVSLVDLFELLEIRLQSLELRLVRAHFTGDM
jgi:hypothetical protein